MATYEQLVDMVLDWSNRDKEVLSRANILTFMDFAADNILPATRIPPLEYVRTSVIGNVGDSENRLTIPSDAIEFIQLRRKDSNSTDGLGGYADNPTFGRSTRTTSGRMTIHTTLAKVIACSSVRT